MGGLDGKRKSEIGGIRSLGEVVRWEGEGVEGKKWAWRDGLETL